MQRFLYQIKTADIGQAFYRLPGCKNLLGQGFGVVAPCDVDKRLFDSDGVIQVENNEQRDRRQEKERAFVRGGGWCRAF